MYSVEDEIKLPYNKAVSAADTAIRKQLAKWGIGGNTNKDRFLLDHLLNTSMNQLNGFTALEANKAAIAKKQYNSYDTKFLDKILTNTNHNKAIQENISEESLKLIAKTLPRSFGEGKGDESYTIVINGNKRTMTADDLSNILIKHLVKIGIEAEKMTLGKFSQGTKIDTGRSL